MSARQLPSTYDSNDGRNWRDDALCAQISPEPWFPPKGSPAKDAKAICAICPVQAECLEFALEAEPAIHVGIWAGYTPRELKALRGLRGIFHDETLDDEEESSY